MDIDFYWKICSDSANDHPGWRWGQVCFNILHIYRPDLANQVRGSRFDPFYVTATDDERYIRFVNFIQENW